VSHRSLEADLERARALSTGDLADAIEEIGFECTRCGACCKANKGDPHDDHDETQDQGNSSGNRPTTAIEEPHTATVFPDEVRDLQQMPAETTDVADGYDWRDVARPMPYGLHEGEAGPEGETFEWALQTDACGDCTFYEETDGTGACTVRDSRPLICETYPFSVVLEDEELGSQPLGQAVDHAGPVRAHECEGLGRDISRKNAEELATSLKERAVRELEEAIGVRDEYVPAAPEPGEVVIHDSEGAKQPDGTRWEGPASQSR
jgi:Fe-S-cluster containining protein